MEWPEEKFQTSETWFCVLFFLLHHFHQQIFKVKIFSPAHLQSFKSDTVLAVYYFVSRFWNLVNRILQTGVHTLRKKFWKGEYLFRKTCSLPPRSWRRDHFSLNLFGFSLMTYSPITSVVDRAVRDWQCSANDKKNKREWPTKLFAWLHQFFFSFRQKLFGACHLYTNVLYLT